MVTEQNVVGPAVIMAFKFDESGAPSVGACKAKRGLNGFGARVRKYHLLHTWDHFDHSFGQGNFTRVLCAEGIRFLQGFDDSFVELGVVGAENEWPPRQSLIEQFVAIYVIIIRTIGTLKKERWTGDISAHTRRNTHCKVL